MEKGNLHQWSEMERRENDNERRAFFDRRVANERRFDYRESNPPPRRSIKSWMRSLSNARLGVDRRKGGDRRNLEDRRSRELRSLLTSEEIAALLRD